MFTLQQLLQALLDALQSLFSGVGEMENRLAALELKLKDVDVNSDGRLQISTDVKFFGSAKTFEVQGNVTFDKDLRVKDQLEVDSNVHFKSDLVVDGDVHAYRVYTQVPINP